MSTQQHNLHWAVSCLQPNANAHLICADPELLAMLREARGLISVGAPQEAAIVLDRAIAQAEGRS
jgi:hypothetical protein